MSDMLFVLGASDPEMQAIEGLLIECGVAVAYAADQDGQRVHPGNACRVEMFVAPPGRELPDSLDPDCGVELVEVECSTAPYLPGLVYTRIDHHRPGDPGYGQPPKDFLAASSIGQVISLLAKEGLLNWPLSHDVGTVGDAGCLHHHHGQYWVTVAAPCGYDWPMAVVPTEYVLAAAADHCLAHAYKGECPGVDPDELMRWRVASRAAHQGRPEAEVLADVESAREELLAAPRLMVSIPPEDQDGLGDSATVDIRDMRGRYVPELPEAAAREGICYVASITDRDGREKVVCQAGSPEQIRLFMSGELVSGLVDYYGDPARGFAGAYIA